mmetsp:Transcript_10066/g.20365  ORF Transcript_10066/g.20365 Transcript_10066/m.20365 type:complete len:90 (-) Transcript_10066:995-1264(-)
MGCKRSELIFQIGEMKKRKKEKKTNGSGRARDLPRLLPVWALTPTFSKRRLTYEQMSLPTSTADILTALQTFASLGFIVVTGIAILRGP